MPANRATLPPDLLSGPFTTAEAAIAGIGRGVLRGPTVRRLARGLYVAAGVRLVTVDQRVVAARRLLPADSLAMGVTALWCYGVEVGALTNLWFCTATRFHGQRRGVRVSNVRRLPPSRGVTVAPEHAFLSAAQELDLVQLVTAGDWLVKRRLTTPKGLAGYVARVTGRSTLAARRAASFVRARVDSPRESRLRMMLVLAGLPTPECNRGIGTDEWFLGHGDLVYEAYRVVLEYEGDQHRTDPKQWNLDIGRYEEFTGEGWTVIRVTAARMRTPRSVVQRVYAALAKGGYGGPPPSLSDAWRQFFD